MTHHTLQWQPKFSNLGETFATECPPTPLPAPVWVAHNKLLQEELGLDKDLFGDESFLLAMAGSTLLDGSTPKASVYSGHQFGVWAGQLGDGRAISLGEIQTPVGVQDIQLKGAGPTPYSRRVDGRAVLRSSIREFLCSEAMFGLGIPTTRALCVTGSPAKVYREEIESAAVVARVSPSFIRFGHFEHFASIGNIDAVRELVRHVVNEHMPSIAEQTSDDKQLALALLKETTHRTAALMADWQAVGFCHGVMNTDNMSILGLTLDYGPFQFLDGFSVNHICNHSDSQGRYAYARQPQIAYWNLFCLTQALMPIIEEQSPVLQVLESYKSLYPDTYDLRMRMKLGLGDAHANDRALVQDLLSLMDNDRVDYPLFWRRLSHAVGESSKNVHAFEPVRDLFMQRDDIDAWIKRYESRLETCGKNRSGANMLLVNPKYVLRNHLGELAIRQAKTGDYSMVQSLLEVLQKPFDEHPLHEAWAGLAPEWASDIEISCSS
ncbi:MAG: YdiU family protein [Betaproteobacteria bacterium]|nr:YdiU family protein [Betaproteobacteria bacterium]